MVSRLLLAVALLFIFESLVQAQESRTDSATVTIDQSVHFIPADGSTVVIDPGQYLVEVAEEWLRLIPEERRDALLLKALPTAHQEAVTQPMARFITREEAQYSLVLLLPGGKGMEALGSVTGVRS